MPSRWLRSGPNKLKKCAERRSDSCSIETDGCCSVIPCRLCIEWETYTEGIKYGSAEFSESSWQGLVAGLTFVSYWERAVIPPEDPESITNSVGMSFAQVLPGTYDMGSPVDETGRDADETIESKTIPDKFFLGSTPVTQAQYAAVMGTNPSTFSGGDKPVETVSFANAQAFCAALNALPAEILAGRSYRIPTEAEWEYACRAGTTTAYNFGADPADLPTNAWFADNSSASTQDVGGKPANAWGFVDMHGNVWEWCQSSRLDADPVIRGGGYDSDAADCRSASREVLPETTTQDNIGFRVAVTYTPPIETQCEYVVELDGEEVYRATCYEGASCRNPQGEVAVLTAYLDGTLRWSRHEPRELPLVDDPDTGCRDHFCGGCHCSCECICVTITDVNLLETKGEICNVNYDCDPPLWVGTVGDYDLSLQLFRNEYGECSILPTIDGNELDPVDAPGCASMSATITLYGGTTIELRCKQCSCEELECDVCDCEFSEPGQCRRGTLKSTTIPDDPCAGTIVNGGPHTIPSGKEAWVVGEDTAIQLLFAGFNITIPCGLFPLDLPCVLVRRAQNPSGPSPHVDNEIVLPCEYYFVVYDNDYNVTFIGYEYELCCGRSVAVPTCQTRLSWIRFLNVSAGRGVYDFLFWSQSGIPSPENEFTGNGVLPGECPFSDGPNPCLS